MAAVASALLQLRPGEADGQLFEAALRDLREMQGLNRTALDIEEQRARIAKLRSETHIPEADSGGVTVEFVDTYGAET